MLDLVFSQEDLQEALEAVEECQSQRFELCGQRLHQLQARSFLAFCGELSEAQFAALLWQWGQ